MNRDSTDNQRCILIAPLTRQRGYSIPYQPGHHKRHQHAASSLHLQRESFNVILNAALDAVIAESKSTMQASTAFIHHPRRTPLRVCVLSLEEVGCLDNYNEMPRCTEHEHISLQSAVDGVMQDKYITVGAELGITAVTEQWSNNRQWRGRASAGYQVLQLVRVGA